MLPDPWLTPGACIDAVEKFNLIAHWKTDNISPEAYEQRVEQYRALAFVHAGRR